MHAQRGFAVMLIVYAVAALAVVGAIYGVYRWIDRSWETTAGIERGRKEVQLAWDTAKAEQRAKEAKQIDTATTKLEKANVQAKVVYRTITRNVDRIIDRPIYRDNACFDSDGLRLARDALRGPGVAAGKPVATVPTVDGVGGRAERDGAAKTD